MQDAIIIEDCPVIAKTFKDICLRFGSDMGKTCVRYSIYANILCRNKKIELYQFDFKAGIERFELPK